MARRRADCGAHRQCHRDRSRHELDPDHADQPDPFVLVLDRQKGHPGVRDQRSELHRCGQGQSGRIKAAQSIGRVSESWTQRQQERDSDGERERHAHHDVCHDLALLTLHVATSPGAGHRVQLVAARSPAAAAGMSSAVTMTQSRRATSTTLPNTKYHHSPTALTAIAAR